MASHFYLNRHTHASVSVHLLFRIDKQISKHNDYVNNEEDGEGDSEFLEFQV